MWEVPLDTQQSNIMVNNILVETTKPELSLYFHAALSIPMKTSLLKSINMSYLNTLPGPTNRFIKKHLDKLINTTVGHLQMRQQILKSTIKKPPDIDLEDKFKTNVFFCTTMDPSKTKEGKFYSDLCRRFPTTSNKGNKYICVMYVYACNAILENVMNNRREKYIIRYFTEFTADFKTIEINPGLHFMENTDEPIQKI